MTDDIRQRIMEYFFEHPDAALRPLGIASILDLPLEPIAGYCRELHDEKILAMTIGSVSFYTASHTREYRKAKRLFEIKRSYRRILHKNSYDIR